MSASPDISTTAGKIADLHQRLAETHRPVGEDSVRATHGLGRLTARERVEALLDEGSFVEIDALARHRSSAFKQDKTRPVTDGVVCGHGTIDGRPVCVFSQDASIFDGRLGEVTGEKIVKVLELALKSGTPIIGFYDGAGARVKEGLVSLEMFSRIYRLQSQASGVIPQVAVVVGEVCGPQTPGVALSDVVIEVHGQGAVALHEGNEAHAVCDAEAGLAHITAADERAAVGLVEMVLGFLPSNNRAVAPLAPAREPLDGVALDSLIPDADGEPFTMMQVIRAVVDEGEVCELQPVFARSVVTCFARVAGRSVGVVANQPAYADGVIDTHAAEKLARFIQLCDAFNVPLVSFIDAPAVAAGSDTGESSASVVRRTAKLLAVTANATVGKVAFVVRRAFGLAYVMMGAKKLGTDLVFAWPTAQIAVDDAQGLAQQLGEPADVLAPMLVNPYVAAGRGLVDAVIPPADTRTRLIDALHLLERKVEDGFTRKHSTMPF